MDSLDAGVVGVLGQDLVADVDSLQVTLGLQVVEGQLEAHLVKAME